MDLKIECILMGLIAVVCCIIYNNTIYNKPYTKDTILFYVKEKQYICNIIASFMIGFLIHYLYKKNNISEMYCKKVCYGDECFMVCQLNKN